MDEEAAWAAIVAGYGQEPPDPPGARPFKPIENLLLPEEDVKPLPKPEPPEPGGAPDAEPEPEPEPPVALGSSVVFAPGVGMTGPRDHSLAEPKDDDVSAAEEGHFVQPEPELPPADTTSKFAWLAVVGGPVLLLLAVLLQWEMTWWLTTLGIGGFLGGFATLVARMAQGDEEDDDPGRGAVV
ncbi:membrane protein [Streptomyces sp. WM6368]|nr:membrane protein [Streptomyces sp. WM6368]